jgi:ABC-type sulfate transport system permease component
MEFLLLWWDDLDDLTHACRHLAASALSEVASSVSAPVAGILSSLVAWVLLRMQA